MRRLFSTLLLFAGTAGCVPQVAPPPRAIPSPAPAPVQAPPPPPPPVRDWRDRPATVGDWVYKRDARGSVALFGPQGADALLVLRCDTARRQVFLSVPGTQAGPAVIRTSSVSRTLQLLPTGGQPPYLAVALTPTDPLLDAMGFSRGRFALEQAGSAPLAIPAWPEIERVTEDCRG